MRINADFTRPAFVAASQYEWVSSPQGGVERVMLDRIGAEQARATSIVRYAPNSHFPSHSHPGGEEILVLSGTFSDADAHYPAGWYLRSPPGSSHQPFSAEGAVIFVKLRQMGPDEHQPVRLNTADPKHWQQQGSRQVCRLFSGASEQVWLQRCAPGQCLVDAEVAGLELLVLAGSIEWDALTLESGGWLRLPQAVSSHLRAGHAGAVVYLKTGHLPAGADQA